jgi:hypothetical protein
MNPGDLLALLRRPATDPLVEAALRHYAVRNRPEVEIDDEDADGPVVETQSWVKNSRGGIEFGFEDEASWIGLDETEFGKRPMLLTQLYLYGQHPGVRPYPYPLPFGLQLSDDRATVRKKMDVVGTNRHSYVRDTWDVHGNLVIVSYAAGDSCIACVLCELVEPPLPPLSYALAPPPSADSLIVLLGLPLSDPAVGQALDPLGLQDHLVQIRETNTCDLCDPYSLMLEFTAPQSARGGTSQEAMLIGMTFCRERELDARAWRGGLPFDLIFEDSPETAERKLGRAPDDRLDDEYSGIALWHEPQFSLRIFYSTVENRLARVSLIAPGVWKKTA